MRDCDVPGYDKKEDKAELTPEQMLQAYLESIQETADDISSLLKQKDLDKSVIANTLKEVQKIDSELDDIRYLLQTYDDKSECLKNGNDEYAGNPEFPRRY